jgi:hypothetical protein
MKEPVFYTKRNRLTRYALACGYIERGGTGDEAYKKLEQISSNGTLRVIVGGRYYRGPEFYLGSNLTQARKVFDNLNAEEINHAAMENYPLKQQAQF